MKKQSLGFMEKIKLSLIGKRYYQTILLPLTVLRRYGFEEFYTKNQIQLSAAALGFVEYYDEEHALALLGNPSDTDSKEKYQTIRKKYGLTSDGAIEVLKVYGKREKYSSDPFGRDQAAETTGGGD